MEERRNDPKDPPAKADQGKTQLLSTVGGNTSLMQNSLKPVDH